MLTFLCIVSIALVLDLLLGDPHSAWHPVALFGGFASKLETLCRKLPLPELLQGGAAWCLAVLPATALAWCAGHYGGTVAAGVIVYFTIALRSLTGHAEAVRLPLRNGNLAGARKALSMIVSRDTAELEESGIVRGVVESLGENLVDAVNSAFFWCTVGFIAGGVPGAAAGAVFLRAVNTLDACWGYRSDRYLRFGRVAARMDDLLHFIPARLSLPVIALAGGAFLRTFRTGFRHRKDHPSPNSGYGMAAFAGALDIRLGGPTAYRGSVEHYPYYGNGRRVLEAEDISRAERLTVVSALLFVLLCITGVAIWFAN